MSTMAALFSALLAYGIPPSDARTLEAAWGDEPDFLDGLEMVASILALKELNGMFPPTGEPWKGIYERMADCITNDSMPVEDAWRHAISGFDTGMQFAITAAVNSRQKAILDYHTKRNKKRPKTKDFLMALQSLGYSFRLNACTQTIEVTGAPITDGMAATIRTQMRDGGFLQPSAYEDAYVSDASLKQYHPIRDYLSSLTWDGGAYINQLAQYFQDSHGVFGVWLRKWLIGSCAKVFESEQNPMLVLDGPQGIGKSEFVRWMVPAKLRKDYFIDGPINTDDKDCEIRLMSKWVWEVSELGATTRKADYEALKGFLTRRSVTVRKPYGKHDIQGPAMASFVGTVNNSSGILSDPTGHRRFLITRIDSINWDYARDMSPDMIWAEAMAAYLGGEEWRLSQPERQRQAEIAEQYEVDDVIEGVLKEWFKVEPSNFTTWTSTSEILRVLEDNTKGAVRGTSKANAMALAATMTKLGVTKKKRTNTSGQLVWGYVGVDSL
jgi:hypothetical protein